MDRIQTMQVFVRIVELRSFTRTADDMNLPRATVTHAIKQLEARLGARLLQRTTRQVRPTADGEVYYERCLRLLADLEEADSAFKRDGLAPRGKLRVDMVGSLAVSVVIPALPDFLARYPGIKFELGTGDRLVDLVREGVDCVLRGGEPQDSSLVARRLAMLQQVTCASPAYLARHGEPMSPDELHAHRAVNYFSALTGRVWDLAFQRQGEVRHLPMPGALAVNSTEAYLACALAGLGIIQLPLYFVAPHLRSGSLREVMPGHRPPPMPLSILYPHHRQLSPRVRVFADWVAGLFDQPAWCDTAPAG